MQKGNEMKNISDTVKQMWHRFTCLFLAMVTVLTLCPVTAFAATTSSGDGSQDTSNRSLGYLNFEATITNGDGKTQPEKKTGSFFAVIMVDQNEKSFRAKVQRALRSTPAIIAQKQEPHRKTMK